MRIAGFIAHGFHGMSGPMVGRLDVAPEGQPSETGPTAVSSDG
jgi:hypothetical protein